MRRASRAANLPCPDRQRTAAGEQPLRAHFRQLDGISDLVVERYRPLEPDDDARLIVILQVAADLGRVGDDGNPKPAQEIGGANPRKLQQLRRLQGAGRQHDFAVRGRAA